MKVNNKIAIFLTILILANLAAAYFYLELPPPGGDSISYYNAMRFLQGHGGLEKQFVLIRLLTSPLMLCLSIFFGFLASDLYSGMLIVNVAFYSLIVGVFYLLVYEIYENRKIAVFSAVLLATNYYLINSANAYLVDLGGWFFMLAASYLAIRYYKTNYNKYYWLSLLFSVVGVFFKEYGALGLLTLFSLILLSNLPRSEKIKRIFGGGLLFAILPAAYHIFYYLKFSFSYFGVYGFTYAQYNIITPNHSFSIFIKVLGWVFSVGWLFFCYGVWQEWRHFDKTRFKLLISLLPLSLSFLAWPGFVQRVCLVLLPFLATLSGRGLADLNKYLAVLLLVAYIIFNYHMGNLVEIINLST